MNNMLSSELIRKGIRYVFAGGADVLIGFKHNRKKQQNTDTGLDSNSVPNSKTCRTELTSSNANE